MRPELICQALMYFKQNNSLYCDIGIALENIQNDLLPLSENSANHQEFDKTNTLEEDENPLDLHRFNSQETMFVRQHKKLVLPQVKEKSEPQY